MLCRLEFLESPLDQGTHLGEYLHFTDGCGSEEFRNPVLAVGAADPQQVGKHQGNSVDTVPTPVHHRYAPSDVGMQDELIVPAHTRELKEAARKHGKRYDEYEIARGTHN